MLWFSPVKALPLVSWFAPAELRDIPEWKVGLCLLLALLEGLRNDPRPPPTHSRTTPGQAGGGLSRTDPCLWNSRALLSKSHQSTPQGKLFQSRPFYPESLPARVHGGRGALHGSWEAEGLLWRKGSWSSPCLPPPPRGAPFRPLPWGPAEPRP